MIFGDDENRNITHIPIYISVVPGLPPVFGSRIIANIGVSALIGEAYRIQGAQLSSIINITSENLHGILGAGIGNCKG